MENDNQAEISNKDVYNLLKSVITKNDEIQKQNENIKDELVQEIRNINTEIHKETEALKQKTAELEEENKILKIRLLGNERKIKKYNIIIYNLQEHNHKIEEIKFLLKILNEKLELECNYTDIRDFYRIGENVEGKIRQFLAEFVNCQLKTEIIVNVYKLKGTSIYISNDHTPEEYQKRNVLCAHLKKARENNQEAKIKRNTLIINGNTFTYEDLLEQPLAGQKELKEQQPGSEKEDTNIGEAAVSRPETAQISSVAERTGELKTFEYLTTHVTENRKRKQQAQGGDIAQKRSNRLKR